nr:SWIM zinc finger family protein [Deltaproteobacteria bacterium]
AAVAGSIRAVAPTGQPLYHHVMSIVTHRDQGLMPLPRESSLKCSCPDGAVMCKHVAAVMYGIGSRLDTVPELLFTLRGVNADELITASITLPMSDTTPAGKIIANDQLSDIFDIEMDAEIAAHPESDPSILGKKSRPSMKRKNSRKKAVRTCAAKAQKAQKESTQAVRTVRNTLKSVALSPQYPTGNSVKKLRKKFGFSVPQFADRLNVSSAIIYRWEKTKGRLNLQKRTLNAIAQLYQQVESK